MAGIGGVRRMAPGEERGGQIVEAAAVEEGAEPKANVSPEEQRAYDEFVTNGMKLIYQGTSVAPAVLDQLRGRWEKVVPSLGEMPPEEGALDPSKPIDNLAVATVALVLALEASAANAGKQVDPAVLFHGGAELMEQLADIAKAAEIYDFTGDEMTGAANRAAMLYGVSSKTMNKQEALAEFDHFLATEGENLGAVLGGIEAGDQGGQPQAQGA